MTKETMLKSMSETNKELSIKIYIKELSIKELGYQFQFTSHLSNLNFLYFNELQAAEALLLIEIFYFDPESCQQQQHFHEFLADYDHNYGMKVVIEKYLEKSDVDKGQCRLSIPGTQIISDDFLTDLEKEQLQNKQKIEVKVRGCSSVEDHNMQLARWNYHQKSISYMLINGWHSLRRENGLEKNDLVRLVSFRSKGHLCLAILKVPFLPRAWGTTGFRGGRRGGITRCRGAI